MLPPPLFAARLCLGPGSLPRQEQGLCRNQSQMPRRPQTLAPPALRAARLCVSSRQGPAIRRVSCLKAPQPPTALRGTPAPARARAMVQPGSQNPAGGGCRRSSDPYGSTRLCKGPDTAPCPAAALFLEVPTSLPGCTLLPVSPVLAGYQPPGHSRASPGPLRRSLPNPGSWHRPFSPLHSPLWHQRPRARPAPGPGFPPALAHDLPFCTLVHGHKDGEKYSADIGTGAAQGEPRRGCLRKDPLPAPSGGLEGFYLLKLEEGKPLFLLCEG